MPAIRRVLSAAVTPFAFITVVTAGAGSVESFEPDAKLHSQSLERSAGWG